MKREERKETKEIENIHITNLSLCYSLSDNLSTEFFKMPKKKQKKFFKQAFFSEN